MTAGSRALGILCLFFATWIRGTKSQDTHLRRMNVNKEFVTVSGFSSGGTFAQHMYVSYSSMFSGVATFSHNFYRCGLPNGIVEDYDSVCTQETNARFTELYDPTNSVEDIKNYFRLGLIDNPYNMANKPLYVFAGTRNYLFSADLSLRIVQVYDSFINNPDVIKTRVAPANLTLPSNRADLPPCASPAAAPFVTNCGFSGALDALQWILGKQAVRPPYGNVALQRLLTFDQTEFFYKGGGDGRNQMDTIGYLYIPKICKHNTVQCLLHFFFHGCLSGREFIGPNQIIASGYLEIAETNGIILLFPQVTTGDGEGNSIGCWDTYGINGEYYATQRGAQVIVVKNMLDRILGLDEDVSSESLQDYTELPKPGPRYRVQPQRVGSTQLLKHSFPGGPYSDATRCTVSRISPDTVLERCVSE